MYSTAHKLYYVEIPNIAVQDLEIAHEVKLGGITVSNYSALSYAYSRLKNDAENTVNTQTAAALYMYWQKAEIYYTK